MVSAWLVFSAVLSILSSLGGKLVASQEAGGDHSRLSAMIYISKLDLFKAPAALAGLPMSCSASRDRGWCARRGCLKVQL